MTDSIMGYSKEEYEKVEYLESLKRKKMTKFQVSFDSEGNPTEDNLTQDQIDHRTWDPGYYVEKNSIFNDILQFDYVSSNVIIFTSINSKKTFRMFKSDFNDLMMYYKMGPQNQVAGKFTFCKKGFKQGIRLVFE